MSVNALGGAPGIYSARYAGPRANDAANNELLIERMAGMTDRRARYECAISLVARGEVLGVFRGEMEGEILETPRGAGGFGYDPYFYYPAFGATLAEVETERTFTASHRRRALDQLFDWLRQYPAALTIS